MNTKDILFIFSGAFNDLNMHLPKIHGSAVPPLSVSGSYLHLATTASYVECGFAQEFMGRVPTRINLSPLNQDDLEGILRLTTSDRSVLRREELSFSHFGMSLSLTDCGVSEVARLCHEDDTGARGLGAVLERVTRDFKFELGGRDYGEEIVIDAEAVRDHTKLLKMHMDRLERMER